MLLPQLQLQLLKKVLAMKLLAVFTGMIVLISLPSCKQPKSKKAASQRAAFSFDPIQTNIDVDFQEQALRAQLNDIPTFVGSSFIAIDDKVPESNLSFIISCQADLSLIKDFYVSEMENLGWQKIAQLDGNDTTLIFQKPRKVCLIIIQSPQSPTIIQIKSMNRFAELQ